MKRKPEPKPKTRPAGPPIVVGCPHNGELVPCVACDGRLAPHRVEALVRPGRRAQCDLHRVALEELAA